MSLSRASQTLIKLLYRAASTHRCRYWIALAIIAMLALGSGKISANRRWNDSKAPTPSLAVHNYGTNRAHSIPAALRDISSTAVTTVSAASFETVIAPESIVAGFGSQLATRTEYAVDTNPNTPEIELPTELAGTTVEVNGRRAKLFYVSSGQVNYLMPDATEPGTANVVIRSGDGTVSNGSVQVIPVAPALFTANSNGAGVAAAILARVKPDGTQGYETLLEYNQSVKRFVTKPISMGPEGERIFLVLFLSGIRKANDPNNDGNLNENIHILMGGDEVTPIFAGRQPNFVGVDQINVEISRSLIGQGVVSVAVIASGFDSSNLADIEIAGATGSFPPQISGFSEAALAGQTLTITGNGFSPNPADNQVRIAGIPATVTSASPTQLTITVPFGVESGTVSIRTSQGEGVSANILPVRTSISGTIENTSRQPISGVAVKIPDSPVTVISNENGAFVLPDVIPGAQSVEIDGGSLQTDPPYPKINLKILALQNRDNPFTQPISIQQAVGSGGSVGGSGSPVSGFAPDRSEGGAVNFSSNISSITIRTGDFQLDFPDNVRATFPNGATNGTIFLTPLENAATPVALPLGFYSSSIVQITPFNVKFDLGGKLVFPNKDGFPPGARATLFRYDPEIGRFIQETAGAVVSADGQRIETDEGAIKITSYYFASVRQRTTTVIGRVFENDSKTPVARANIRFRGQEAQTDGNGSFVLRYVPVTNGETFSVEVRYLRSNGRVDRVQSPGVTVYTGGVIKIPDVFLPSEKENRPPTILAPPKLEIEEGKTYEFRIAVTDPDQGQTIQVILRGPQFAAIRKQDTATSSTYVLRLAPGATDSGQYTLTITATDSGGASAAQDIALTVMHVNRSPVATGQSVTVSEDATAAITLNASDPDGDRLTYTIVTPPANGSLSGAAPNLSYTPSPNYHGPDQFTFRVNDGTTSSNTATVTITVNSLNDPPELSVPGSQTVNLGQLIEFAVSASDPDTGQTLTISADQLPAGAVIRSISPTSSQFSWTPNANQPGVFRIVFRVADNGSPQLSSSKEVQITVNEVRGAKVSEVRNIQ